jgi:hypothetical protein
VALGWVHQGVHVVVGFQGVNPTNIALDLAVARHLIWITASPSSLEQPGPGSPVAAVTRP